MTREQALDKARKLYGESDIADIAAALLEAYADGLQEARDCISETIHPSNSKSLLSRTANKIRAEAAALRGTK